MNWREEVFEVVQQTTVQLLKPNPKRAGFFVCNTAAPGTNLNPQLNLWINEDVDAERGFILPSSTRSLLCKYADFGPIVCQGWWLKYTVTGPSANVFIQVYEYEYTPDKFER